MEQSVVYFTYAIVDAFFLHTSNILKVTVSPPPHSSVANNKLS